MDRRSFLRGGVLGAVSISWLPGVLSAAANSNSVASSKERYLSFYSLHTGEALKTVYWAEGEYVSDSLSEIQRILRDFRTGDVHPIDPRLLDALWQVRRMVATKGPFEIISGYRSPKTNAELHANSNGVAENSLHLKGMAADVRLPDRGVAAIRKAALSLKAGGVGYYPASKFVHIDVGRVRSW